MTSKNDPIITLDIHVDPSPKYDGLCVVIAYPVHNDGGTAWVDTDHAVARGMITDTHYDGVSRIVTANEDADWRAEGLSTAATALVYAVLVEAQQTLDLPDSAVGFPDAAAVWASLR